MRASQDEVQQSFSHTKLRISLSSQFGQRNSCLWYSGVCVHYCTRNIDASGFCFRARRGIEIS